jgi:hypothetical protein
MTPGPLVQLHLISFAGYFPLNKLYPKVMLLTFLLVFSHVVVQLVII